MGDCKQCGNCCLYVEVKMRNNAFDKQWRKFLKVTRPDTFIFTNSNKNMKIVAPCKHLDIETNKCKIYYKRPKTCREYECQ
jgi:Fe-S-cluster containining protein